MVRKYNFLIGMVTILFLMSACNKNPNDNNTAEVLEKPDIVVENSVNNDENDIYSILFRQSGRKLLTYSGFIWYSVSV